MAAEKNNIAASSGEGNGYEMKLGLGTIAMLISATGMGLVPLFSRWATRTICSMVRRVLRAATPSVL